LARLASIKTRLQGPRQPTAGGLNTGCRAQPCRWLTLIKGRP